MTSGEIVNTFASSEPKKNISLLLTYHCAPILKGSKAANIMTIDTSMYRVVSMVLASTDISHLLLRIRDDKSILYLYRRDALAKILGDAKVKKFLECYGYKSSDTISAYLKRLSERIELYSSGETHFPHEIGIFLDYPIEDVRGFILNGGKHYLCAGYWKVYHDEKAAQKIFKLYDRQRDTAMTELLAGKTISEIAV